MKKLIVILSIATAGAWAVPALAANPAPRELCGCAKGAQAPVAHKRKPRVGTKARCPVMKHDFTVGANTKFSYYKGRWYAFCCPGCKPKFDKNPSHYLP